MSANVLVPCLAWTRAATVLITRDKLTLVNLDLKQLSTSPGSMIQLLTLYAMKYSSRVSSSNNAQTRFRQI